MRLKWQLLEQALNKQLVIASIMDQEHESYQSEIIKCRTFYSNRKFTAREV